MSRLARMVRRVNVGLMLMLLASLALAYAVPQLPEPLDESTWPALLQPLAGVIRALGADRVFGTWWFSALLGAVALGSLLALAGQSALAWRRAFGTRTPSGKPLAFSRTAADDVLARARRHGYLVVRRSESAVKAVKHPWGHWGTTLLHAGIVIATVSSWYVLQSTATGVIQLAEGETFAPGQPWGIEEGGALAEPLVLPTPITLLRSEAEYWPDGSLRQVRSTIAFGAEDTKDVATVEVNGSVARGSVRLYQSQRVGSTLLVTVEGPSGEERVRVDSAAPAAPDVPSYEDYPLADGSTLRLKYFSDTERVSMTGVPEVVARMERDGNLLGQETLVSGVGVAVGDYEVTLFEVRAWTQLIVVSTRGMAAVFVGFVVILLGSLLLYVWPPRELFIETDDDTAHVWWRAWRFPDVYSDERERVFGAAREAMTDD
ncbi:MAG: cytochrome c biogenesis protein ResB [Coriobacteriia bacterium]|nr:cytochrome c biogenesis protein ResB [Coriobacteriia bacterium]